MAIYILAGSECKYEAMQWLVVTMAGEEETGSACLWMCSGQFDSNLVEPKSMLNEILQNKVMQLLHKHE